MIWQTGVKNEIEVTTKRKHACPRKNVERRQINLGIIKVKHQLDYVM